MAKGTSQISQQKEVGRSGLGAKRGEGSYQPLSRAGWIQAQV